ncbi:hypothetical protein ABJY88_05230, partial [Vibrio parahaemolyticus]|uniref:hypothetical protein n=1 Tax=Vibrio parahaemolyticus TaxID=670 RepID=UPI0032AFE9B7
MSRIPAERKEAILKKLLPPYSMSVSQLSKEEGISTATPGGVSRLFASVNNQYFVVLVLAFECV